MVLGRLTPRPAPLPFRAHPQGQQLFVQFVTRYLHWSGALRCRVTTMTRFWTDGSNTAGLLGGFDQEAAAVVRWGGWIRQFACVRLLGSAKGLGLLVAALLALLPASRPSSAALRASLLSRVSRCLI